MRIKKEKSWRNLAPEWLNPDNSLARHWFLKGNV